MNNAEITEIEAVAFDIDGTLYPDYRLHLRLIPFCVRRLRLMIAFGMTRSALHKKGYCGNIFAEQAKILAGYLRKTEEQTAKIIDDEIYNGWTAIYKKVKLFKNVRETLEAFRARGLKTGVLSDFLPYLKIANWGLSSLFDVMLGSEETGALKPSPIPFKLLADTLKTDCSRILYVGNSKTLDCDGARSAGMKTALITPRWNKNSGADITFHTYKELQNAVLGAACPSAR